MEKTPIQKLANANKGDKGRRDIANLQEFMKEFEEANLSPKARKLIKKMMANHIEKIVSDIEKRRGRDVLYL